jgi:Right handed beta helix region
VIANSTWRNNRAGIVPNSGSYEPNAPERENTIVGNLVYDNNNGKTPAIDIAVTAMGNGILIAGGEDNVIERNRVWNHELGGIVVITYPESAEYVWKANGNKVRDNVARDNRLGDLGLWIGDEEKGNCFSDNEFGTTSPLDLEAALPCKGTGTGDLSRGGFDVGKLATNEGKPDAVPYEETELPPVPPQPEMPDAATAKATAAIDAPMKVDVQAIRLPAAPTDAGS